MAQDTAPTLPLPPFDIRYGQSTSIVPPAGGIIASPGRSEFTGGVRLVWGDVTLTADRLSYDGAAGRIEASGNIVLTRGVETVRGDSITFDLKSGDFTVLHGVVISPPYRISGERLARVNGMLQVDQAVLTPDVEGKGELRIRARELQMVAGQYTSLTDVQIYAYGMRVLTVRRRTLKQENGTEQAQVPMIPVRLRYTRISGFAPGLELPWKLTRGTTAESLIYFPTRNGPQYSLKASYDLFGAARGSTPTIRRVLRDSLFGVPASPATPGGPSPLRRLLTVHPSPGPDPVLDFQGLLSTPESVGSPLKQARSYAMLTEVYSDKEEIDNKRQGDVLLSRQPESGLAFEIPLSLTSPNGGKPFATNHAVRRYLTLPRFALTTNLTSGTYQERRLTGADPSLGIPNVINSSRNGGTVGVEMLPMLIGANVLFQAHCAYSYFDYGNRGAYRIPEYGVAAEYIVGRRTMIGAAFVKRDTSGQTPFFFDQIDTRDEGQTLLQTSLTKRITIAGLLRYDVDNGDVFDWGVTVGIRGRSLEPRISYRRLGNSIGAGFNLVGL